MRWDLKKFEELSVPELYAALRLRAEVFVVEQNCVYQDCDDLDSRCHHLLGRSEEGALLAYGRIAPPGLKYPEASFGRVVTSPAARGQGRGRNLVGELLRSIEVLHGGPVRISAQAYLENFYADFGFARTGENYLEDGIPHLAMRRG